MSRFIKLNILYVTVGIPAKALNNSDKMQLLCDCFKLKHIYKHNYMVSFAELHNQKAKNAYSLSTKTINI